MLLGEVICAFLEEQFEAYGVTDKDVRRSFDGRTLLAAQTALVRLGLTVADLKGLSPDEQFRLIADRSS